MSDEIQSLNKKVEELEKKLNEVTKFLNDMPHFWKYQDRDELYEKAIEIVKKEGRANASLLQRTLSIGYNRAMRILDQMSENGIVSKKGGNKREILEK